MTIAIASSTFPTTKHQRRKPLMRIANITRQAALATTARIADDPLSRLIGLLGRSTLLNGEGLIIRPCTSIHMLGMRFAIDALYIDHGNRIIQAVSQLAPWRIGPIDFRAAYVIELPSGTIVTTGTMVGDEVKIEI
jgi:uncharacterized protein